jgi:DNA-binding MarR family transcriptional regulator
MMIKCILKEWSIEVAVFEKSSLKAKISSDWANDKKLWILFDRARSLISKAREIELVQYGLTPEKSALLSTLQTLGGKATHDEIADVLIRNYNSITILVNKMQKSGLVKKEKSTKGRKTIISITPKGKEIYENISTKSIEMAFSDLSPEDKQRLISILEQLITKGRFMLGMDYKLPFL